MQIVDLQFLGFLGRTGVRGLAARGQSRIGSETAISRGIRNPFISKLPRTRWPGRRNRLSQWSRRFIPIFFRNGIASAFSRKKRECADGGRRRRRFDKKYLREGGVPYVSFSLLSIFSAPVFYGKVTVDRSPCLAGLDEFFFAGGPEKSRRRVPAFLRSARPERRRKRRGQEAIPFGCNVLLEMCILPADDDIMSRRGHEQKRICLNNFLPGWGAAAAFRGFWLRGLGQFYLGGSAWFRCWGPSGHRVRGALFFSGWVAGSSGKRRAFYWILNVSSTFAGFWPPALAELVLLAGAQTGGFAFRRGERLVHAPKPVERSLGRSRHLDRAEEFWRRFFSQLLGAAVSIGDGLTQIGPDGRHFGVSLLVGSTPNASVSHSSNGG
jgi:hypothetical protein